VWRLLKPINERNASGNITRIANVSATISGPRILGGCGGT
jgi:hypothetical protein